ncbi:hypothetical protein V0288_23820 [Pannus brasiliensis CCIBt3594]|uniref:Uncharacterized protein n=1 Tax=Pannus brasiliensis CCIBt3594 TaxID=1427578 RepID=A0AAW9QY02_9CHRO
MLICAGKKHTNALHKIYYELYQKFPDDLSFLNYINTQAVPLGVAVAVANITDCVPAESIEPQLSEIEKALGDYQKGMRAWTLDDIKKIQPFPIVGQQWLFDIPDNIIQVIQNQNQGV